MFTHDPALSAHLASLQPPPERQPAPPSRQKAAGVHLGTLATVIDGSFAFVKPDAPIEGVDRDTDLFVHRSRMAKGLSRGDRVCFNVHRSTRRPGAVEAIDVVRAA